MLSKKQTQVINLVGKVVRAKKGDQTHIGVLKSCTIKHPGQQVICHVVDKDYKVKYHQPSEISPIPELKDRPVKE